jgi:hypothetical protein
VYIVNLYPAIEKKLLQDPDLILGRDIEISSSKTGQSTISILQK